MTEIQLRDIEKVVSHNIAGGLPTLKGTPIDSAEVRKTLIAFFDLERLTLIAPETNRSDETYTIAGRSTFFSFADVPLVCRFTNKNQQPAFELHTDLPESNRIQLPGVDFFAIEGVYLRLELSGLEEKAARKS